jgi:hypothetical protein
MFRKLSPVLFFLIGVAATGLVFALMPSASADSPSLDTIVGINPGVEPYQLTIRPGNGVQPVYGVFVSQSCRDTLHVGDAWPSSTPVCK